mgnify:CR=1 FL=1
MSSNRKQELSGEAAFLERLQEDYAVATSSQTRVLRELTMRTFRPYIHGGFALELGCSDGYMTSMLAGLVEHLDVVDASSRFIEQAAARGLANVSYIHSLFESYQTEQRYDHIFASFVLEHVLEPDAVLDMARGLLRERGLLFVAVPNARALSRQWAVHMGLLPGLYALTENDIRHGHRRVYDRVSLNRDLASAGFESIAEGGLMLKIFADFQMDSLIDDGTLGSGHIDGLYRMGLEYPDLCGALFSVCRRRG